MKIKFSYILLVGGVLPLSALAGEGESTTTSLFKTLGKTVLKGVATKTGGTFAGWGLSAIGGAIGIGGSGKQIGEELMNIEATLDTMEKDLQKIESAIEQQTCAQDKDDITTDLSYIMTQYQTYTDFLNATNLDHDPPYYPSPMTCEEGSSEYQVDSCPQAWADEVIANMMSHLNNIHAALTSEGDSGILKDCMRTFPLPSNSTDDAYFENAYEMLNYYYRYQTWGIMMYIEAKHYYAWIDAGQPQADPKNPKSTTYLCNHDINNEVHNACKNAYNNLAYVHKQIHAQFEVIGAPYASQDRLVYYKNPKHKDSKHNDAVILFPRSLDAFGKRLTYMLPDDVADHKYTTAGKPILGYSSWKPADFDDLRYFSGNRNNTESTFSYMNRIGFYGMGDFLLLSTRKKTVTLPHHKSSEKHLKDNPWEIQMSPFWDLGITHKKQSKSSDYHRHRGFFDEKDVKDLLLSRNYDDTYHAGYKPPSASGKGSLYNALLNSTYMWQFMPGWMHGGGKRSYTLPKIDLDDMQCSGKNKKFMEVNDQKIYIMCGDDKQEFFDKIIPPPLEDVNMSILNSTGGSPHALRSNEEL